MLIKSQSEPLSYRYEQKYIITYEEYLSIKNKLKVLLPINDSNEGDFYQANTIYLDSPTLKCYKDITSGIENQIELRARYYNGSIEHFKLEIKEKKHNYVTKAHTTIKQTQFHRFFDMSTTDKMDFQDNNLIKKWLYKINHDHFRPKVLISYEREAYISPFHFLRINFDSNITTCALHQKTNKPAGDMISLLKPNEMILELMYYESLPAYLMPLFSSLLTTHSTISKYVLAIQALSLSK